MTAHRLAVLALLGTLAACLPDEQPQTDACIGCHGDTNWAPPMALGGETDPSAIGVGAHQQHLQGLVRGVPVACTECHLVPTTLDGPGHLDASPGAEIRWGELATADGVAAVWNRDNATCITYCHGATLPGAVHPTPVWTVVDGTQVGCTSCHGNPPPPPHVDDDACADCHVVHADGTGAHINGVVDFAEGIDCTDCHGNPPALPHPANDTCADCHPPSAEGLHRNGTVDFVESFSSCDGCHGNPPSPPHTSNSACADCHPSATGGDTHLNGTVDISQPPTSCDGCHGAAPTFAPPPDLAGSTDTTERGVGAHQAHLNTTKGPPIGCDTCHVVPTTRDDPGHLDDPLPAEVKWNGGLAVAGGAAGTWDPVALTCEVYCHGPTLGGAEDPIVEWTRVDGTQGDCGSCHGNPPPSHVGPIFAVCGDCHQNFPNPGDTHIDGTLDFAK